MSGPKGSLKIVLRRSRHWRELVGGMRPLNDGVTVDACVMQQIIEEYFDSAPWEDDWDARYNIAPTQLVPVIRQNPN